MKVHISLWTIRKYPKRHFRYLSNSGGTFLPLYVTPHRCAGGLKNFDIRSGSQRHRLFVGFFNVPVQAPTRGEIFYTVIPTNRPIQLPFTTRWGYGGHILDFTPPPRVPTGADSQRSLPYQFQLTDLRPPYPQRVVKGDLMGRCAGITV